MNTTIQAIRSTVFLLCMAVLTFTHATIILLLCWLPRRVIEAVVTNWCSVNLYLLKIICGLSYEAKGLEQYKQAVKQFGGVVLMAKHQSTMETMILQSIVEPKPALVLKKELLNIPFYGWALARLKPIAINRKEKSSAMEQVIHFGGEALKEGRSVLIFPEGTRTPAGKETLIKKGGVNLALATGSMIVPVALNTGLYWGKGQFIKKAGTAKVSFGPVVDTSGKTVNELQQALKTWIDQEIATF